MQQTIYSTLDFRTGEVATLLRALDEAEFRETCNAYNLALIDSAIGEFDHHCLET